MSKNPWFVYSKSEDGLFCLPCVLFASGNYLGKFVSENFNHWSKKNSAFDNHNNNNYHKFAFYQFESLKSFMLRPQIAVDNQLGRITEVEIVNNRAVIKHIADAIHLCGSHNISLRGHRDDNTADVHSNKGNFLAILDYSVRSGNTTLAEHFKGAARNVVYTSKTIQNQLIQAIGDHIRDKIIKEIKQAKYYSILCDEVSDIYNKEQVSIV